MIKYKFFITRTDGSHRMKIFKNIFSHIDMDENNYIKLSLKPHTMSLTFDFCCISFDFYLKVLKCLILNSSLSSDVVLVFDTLLLFMDSSDRNFGKKKNINHYDKGSITIIIDENKKGSDWIFYAIDIWAFEIGVRKSLDIDSKNTYAISYEQYIEDPIKFSIYYDYEHNKFFMHGGDGNPTLLNIENAIFLAILYNAGGIKENQTIILENKKTNATIRCQVRARS